MIRKVITMAAAVYRRIRRWIYPYSVTVGTIGVANDWSTSQPVDFIIVLMFLAIAGIAWIQAIEGK